MGYWGFGPWQNDTALDFRGDLASAKTLTPLREPKELWALITWIVYLIVIHIRFTTKQRALVTAWLSVVGFVVMLWTYFGVNLLLPGLHAYA